MKGGGKILLYLNALRWMLYRFFHDSYLMLVILLIIDLSIVFQVTTSNAISISFFFFFSFLMEDSRMALQKQLILELSLCHFN